MTSTPFDESNIKRELKIHAKALRIPPGSAEIFIDKAMKDALRTLKSKKLITNQDLDRALVKELKKYHPDLAYVYENYDKII